MFFISFRHLLPLYFFRPPYSLLLTKILKFFLVRPLFSSLLSPPQVLSMQTLKLASILGDSHQRKNVWGNCKNYPGASIPRYWLRSPNDLGEQMKGRKASIFYLWDLMSLSCFADWFLSFIRILNERFLTQLISVSRIMDVGRLISQSVASNEKP